MEANTHMHTHEQEWSEHTHEQEWNQTYTCTHYSKSGSECTCTHTITRMEVNTHMHTHEQEWRRTHICTH